MRHSEYLTLSEAAEFLNYSGKWQLQKDAKSGKLPGVRMNDRGKYEILKSVVCVLYLHDQAHAELPRRGRKRGTKIVKKSVDD